MSDSGANIRINFKNRTKIKKKLHYLANFRLFMDLFDPQKQFFQREMLVGLGKCRTFVVEKQNKNKDSDNVYLSSDR